MKPIPLMVAVKFGRLTVLAEGPRDRGDRRRWLCRCECGKEISVEIYHLRNGRTISCGCQRKIARNQRPTIHGNAVNGVVSPEYRSWQAMIARCENPANKQYARYGGRGIAVCDRWRHDFAAFLADVGPRPSLAHSIDRYPNNDGNYEPGNCRWATQLEQQNNRSTNRLVEIDGTRRTASEWSRISGISDSTICNRLDLGWLPRAAVFAPLANRPPKGMGQRYSKTCPVCATVFTSRRREAVLCGKPECLSEYGSRSTIRRAWRPIKQAEAHK